MATTLGVVHELVTGIRTTADAVVASGTATFYLPGTLTLAAVYSDDAGSSAIASSVVTLNSSGQYRYVYADGPRRMIVKDSTGTTTIIDTIVNIARAKQVYITNTNVNGGVETTLDAYLSSLSSDGGTSYLESGSATTRGTSDYLRKDSVQAQDFAATGDGTTNDTTFLQAGIDHCVATGKPFHIPAGTYKITGPLTITGGQCIIYGDGPKLTIIKNYGTTTNALVFNFAGSTDAPFVVRDLSITADTTSTGAAITNTNANNARFINVETSLHRTGITASGATGCILERCVVLSTDGNAAGIGLRLGGTGVALACNALAATGKAIVATGDYSKILGGAYGATGGTAIEVIGTGVVTSGAQCGTSTTGVNMATGSASVLTDVQVSGNTTTGIANSQNNATIKGCVVAGTSTNGVTSSGTGCVVSDCVVTGNAATAGIAVSGVDSEAIGCRIVGTSTTGISCTAARATVSASSVIGNCTSGIVISAANSAVQGCTVQGTSTTGITVSAINSTATGSFVTGNATTGILCSAAGTKAVASAVSGTCTTGISLTGAGAAAIGCTVTASVTGVSLGAAGTKATTNYVDGATTGFSVGAFANCVVTGNTGATNTSDCTVNASATVYAIHSNEFSAFTDNAALVGTWHTAQQRLATKVFSDTSSSATHTFTPDLSTGVRLFRYLMLSNATMTIANPTGTSGLTGGDEIVEILANFNVGGGASNIVWGNAYNTGDGGVQLAAIPAACSVTGHQRSFRFLVSSAGQMNMISDGANVV